MLAKAATRAALAQVNLYTRNQQAATCSTISSRIFNTFANPCVNRRRSQCLRSSSQSSFNEARFNTGAALPVVVRRKQLAVRAMSTESEEKESSGHQTGKMEVNNNIHLIAACTMDLYKPHLATHGRSQLRLYFTHEQLTPFVSCCVLLYDGVLVGRRWSSHSRPTAVSTAAAEERRAAHVCRGVAHAC